MEPFIIKYSSPILIGVVIIISLSTLFRVPKNLEKAIEDISSAEKMMNSSMLILNSQDSLLDILIQINEDLLLELDTLRNNNTEMAKSIDQNLKNASWFLKKIKDDIEDLPLDYDTIQ